VTCGAADTTAGGGGGGVDVQATGAGAGAGASPPPPPQAPRAVSEASRAQREIGVEVMRGPVVSKK
jgi:hypothetical protein